MQRPSRPQDLLLFITSPKPRSTLQKLYSKVTGTRLHRSRPHPQQKCLICFSHISSKKHSRFFVFWGSRQKTKKLKESPKTSLGLKPQLLQILFIVFLEECGNHVKRYFCFELRPFVRMCPKCVTRTLSSYICIIYTTDIQWILCIIQSRLKTTENQLTVQNTTIEDTANTSKP